MKGKAAKATLGHALVSNLEPMTTRSAEVLPYKVLGKSTASPRCSNSARSSAMLCREFIMRSWIWTSDSGVAFLPSRLTTD